MLKIHFETTNTKTIIFFPFLGGFAFRYRSWADYVSKEINLFSVEYPGRGMRVKAPFQDNFLLALKDIEEQIAPYLKQSLILVGECLGAYFAYELAVLLQERQQVCPELLLTISAKSPQTHDSNYFAQLSETPPQDLFIKLKEIGGLDDATFPTQTSFGSYLLDLIRRDFKVGASYSLKSKVPLKTPILSLIGKNDTLFRDESSARLWGELTDNFQLMSFDGGHFFSNQHIREIATIINLKCAESL